METTQSSTMGPHLKVQRLSKSNSTSHPTGLIRAFIAYCDIDGCPNYQVIQHLPRGRMGSTQEAIVLAALKGWEINVNASVVYCPTHKQQHNPQGDYTSVGTSDQLRYQELDDNIHAEMQDDNAEQDYTVMSDDLQRSLTSENR